MFALRLQGVKAERDKEKLRHPTEALKIKTVCVK